MLRMKETWAIRQLAKINADRVAKRLPRKTQDQLAVTLGRTVSVVSRIFTGKRALKLSEAPAVASFLEVSLDVLQHNIKCETSSEIQPLRALESNVKEAQFVQVTSEFPRDIPVYGTAVGGSKGDFLLNGQAVDYVRRPPGLAGARGVFALFVQGSSMSPRYNEGDLVYVHPGRPTPAHSYVIVELKPLESDDGEAPPAYLKMLIKRTATKLILAQHNPSLDDIEIPLDEVGHVYHVMELAELLGT